MDKMLVEELKIKSVQMSVGEAEYATQRANPLGLYDSLIPALKE